ncbi:pyridoxal phosphate-dependent transferase [Lentinula edodes]|nr:pyridoxal phosphate-dependent transferase [Lentinula edodes]
MYNGIGLTTPRGSGTNGYVIRNLSTLRSYEPAQDRASAWDVAPPKHREPDQGILEHERKRQVEVKCLELQLELEEKDIDEEEIEKQVDELRTKLNANLNAYAMPSTKRFKPSDTHAIAAAKKSELDKMARALGTRRDYAEGQAFDRERQEQDKIKRQVDRGERERRKEEDRAKMAEQKAKWDAERREKDRLRRREEDRLRREREEGGGGDLRRKQDNGSNMPPPPPARDRSRERYRGRDRSPPRRPRQDSRSRSPRRRSPSPLTRSSRRRSPSASRSPSRSRSPPRVRRRSVSTPRRRSGSPPSPPHGNRRDQRSVTAPSRRRRSPSDSVSPPRVRVEVKGRGRSPSPRDSRRSRSRSRSVSSDSAMSAVPRPISSIPSAPCTKYKAVTHDTAQKSERTQATLSRAKEYILPVYARPDFVLSHGKGSYVWDTEGRKYLDFSAGIAVNALGHSDEGVTKVLAQQSQQLLHTSNVYHNEWAAKLAELLVTLTQKEGGLGYPAEKSPTDGATPGAKVFFSNSGTEANEGALKIARKVGKDRWASNAAGRSWDSKDCTKTRIACFESSFHGRSMGALSVTSSAKYQLPFAPLLPGIDVGKVNDFNGLSSLIGEDTCAVIVEPIQGEGGINSAQTEWLAALRQRCDQVGAVLIFDEIQCGLYRTGTLWAHSLLPVECHPDIVTMAKPLANGYPIGSVLLRDSVASTMTAGTHGTTFGGSPIACAVGYHVLSRLSDRPFVAQIAETSAYLSGRLSQLPTWFPDILQPTIRGRGLILGLAFKDEKDPGRLIGAQFECGQNRGGFGS